MTNAERNEVLMILLDEARERVELLRAGQGGRGEACLRFVRNALDRGEERVDRVGFLQMRESQQKREDLTRRERTSSFRRATPATSVFVSLGTLVSVSRNSTLSKPLRTSILPSRPLTARRNAIAPPSVATVLSTPEGVP